MIYRKWITRKNVDIQKKMRIDTQNVDVQILKKRVDSQWGDKKDTKGKECRYTIQR